MEQAARSDGPAIGIFEESEATALVSLRRQALLAFVTERVGVLPPMGEVETAPVNLLSLADLEVVHMLTARLEEAVRVQQAWIEAPPSESPRETAQQSAGLGGIGLRSPH